MKGIVLTAAVVGLAGNAAIAQETEDYNPEEDIATETPRSSETYDPSRDIATDEDRSPDLSMGESKTDSPVNTDFGSEVADETLVDEGVAGDEGLSNATAGDLEGRTVLTLDGEEIGEIRKVGRKPDDGQRVATVDVGGFLGVGERTIAIPLSKLNAADGEIVRVSMMRTSLEAEPEFDESKLAPDEPPAS